MAAIAEVTGKRCVATNAGSTAIAFTYPGTPTAGNLLVAVMSWRGDTTISAVPSGWTLAKAGGNGSGIDSAIYYKVAGASEPTGHSWTLAVSNKASGVATEFSPSTGSLWVGTVLDKTNANTGSGTAGTTGLTGTLSQASEAIVACYANINSYTWSTHNNSQVEAGESASTGGSATTRNNTSMGVRVVAATTDTNYGATLSTTNTWSTAVATFKDMVATTVSPSAATCSAAGRVPTAAPAANPQDAESTASTAPQGYYETVILADSPVAYWRLDEASGNVADSSGNGHTLTAYGSGLWYGSMTLIHDPWDASIRMGFTSDGDFRTTAVPDWWVGSALTAEFWYVPPAAESHGYISLLGTRDGTANYFCITALTGSNVLECRVTNSAGTQVDANVTVTPGVANHVIVAWDGSYVRSYLNGSLQTTSPALGGSIETPTALFGLNWATTNWRGAVTLDEVALYNSGLTGTQALAHYNAGSNPPGAVAVGGKAVSPAVATVTTAGRAPVAGPAPAPDHGSATADGYVPTAAPGPKPGVAASTAAGYAPTATGMGMKTVSPAAAASTGAGNAPTVQAFPVVETAPGTATVAGEAYSAAPVAGISVAPAAATVTSTGRPPSSVWIGVWSAAGAGTASGNAPTVQAFPVASVVPAAASSTAATRAPTAHPAAIPPAASGSAAGNAPTPVAGINVSAGTASSAAAGGSPTAQVRVAGGVATVAASGRAPAVTGMGLTSVAPAAATATTAGRAPAVTGMGLTSVAPAAATVTVSGYSPTAVPLSFVSAGVATATAAGRAPTANTWAYPAADVATATATANGPSAWVRVTAASASSSATAYAATAGGTQVYHFAPSLWVQNVSPQAGTFGPPDVVVVGDGGPVTSASATVQTLVIESPTPETHA